MNDDGTVGIGSLRGPCKRLSLHDLPGDQVGAPAHVDERGTVRNVAAVRTVRFALALLSWPRTTLGSWGKRRTMAVLGTMSAISCVTEVSL